MCHKIEITLWKANCINYKARFSINLLLNNKIKEKNQYKMTEKINLSLSWLTRKTHDPSYKTMITL